MRSPTGPGSDPPSGPTQLPRTVPSARPEGVSVGTPTPSGPFCWSCDRYAVDIDGDFCDLCLDAIGDELEQRMIGSGW